MGGKGSSSSDSSQRKRDVKHKSKKSRSSSSSSSSRRKSGKRKKPVDGKRSRSRSGSRRRRKRSPSQQRNRKTQPGASTPMLGYASLHQQHQQMMMQGLWGNAPPPWAMPPPKDAQANKQKKEKKDKKEKKEKKEKEDKEREAEKERKAAESAYLAQVAALEDKVKAEVASRKEVEERLKASDIENEKLRAQLAEAQKAQEQQAIRDRTQLKHYIKELNAKNGEIRIFEEKLAAHASEMKAKDLELRNELEKNRNASSQIAHLTSVREGLLATVRNLKDRCRQLKVSAKKNEVSGTVAPSSPVTKASVTSVTPEGTTAAQDGPNSRTTSAGDGNDQNLESELSHKVKVAKIRSRPLVRREKVHHASEEPRHREANAVSSAVRKRNGETSGDKRSISFAAEESIAKSFDIVSFAAYKKKLWWIKAGSTLECNGCSNRAALSQGNLNLDPNKGQFMQERFLCEACCGIGTTPPGRPATNLLLADESQSLSGVLNANSEQEDSAKAPVLNAMSEQKDSAKAPAQADVPSEVQNDTSSVVADNTLPEKNA